MKRGKKKSVSITVSLCTSSPSIVPSPTFDQAHFK